jgi:hypothetical protein
VTLAQTCSYGDEMISRLAIFEGSAVWQRCSQKASDAEDRIHCLILLLPSTTKTAIDEFQLASSGGVKASMLQNSGSRARNIYLLQNTSLLFNGNRCGGGGGAPRAGGGGPRGRGRGRGGGGGGPPPNSTVTYHSK